MKQNAHGGPRTPTGRAVPTTRHLQHIADACRSSYMVRFDADLEVSDWLACPVAEDKASRGIRYQRFNLVSPTVNSTI